MAICPNHGGYTGDSCKKCAGEGMKEIQNMADGMAVKAATGPPKLDSDDRATVLQLENHVLKLIQQHQAATTQLQMFINAMFQKYEVKQSEYLFDVDKTGFVARGM